MIRSSNVRNVWKATLAAIAVLAVIAVPRAHAQESPQDRYNRAVELFNRDGRGEAETACDIMNQLIQEVPGNQQYQAAANSYCRQVGEMHRVEKNLFNQGIQDAQSNNCHEARVVNGQMSDIKTRDSTYRNKLLTAVQSCETRATAQHPSHEEQGQTNSGHDGMTSEAMLRAGIQAYFKGDLTNLTTAEEDFTRYLSNPGDRKALAYFFRGATRCSRFYLSGETDINLKNSAVEDFRIAHQRNGTFEPPAQFFSPKVLALYQAASQP